MRIVAERFPRIHPWSSVNRELKLLEGCSCWGVAVGELHFIAQSMTRLDYLPFGQVMTFHPIGISIILSRIFATVRSLRVWATEAALHQRTPSPSTMCCGFNNFHRHRHPQAVQLFKASSSDFVSFSSRMSCDPTIYSISGRPHSDLLTIAAKGRGSMP